MLIKNGENGGKIFSDNNMPSLPFFSLIASIHGDFTMPTSHPTVSLSDDKQSIAFNRTTRSTQIDNKPVFPVTSYLPKKIATKFESLYYSF